MSEQRAAAAAEMARSFGYRAVGADEKQVLVDGVFHKVAERYDLMNDLMSAGLHRLWKQALVTTLNPSRRGNWHVLDVAGGTGDVAFRIVEASQRNARATVLDINGSMLDVGRERAARLGLGGQVSFVEANAEALPFSGGTFDAYTIAFGIRNVPDIQAALAEAYRVLKYGRRFLCLEFSAVDMPALDSLYDAWSFQVIPRLGGWVAGDPEPYAYLVESIRKFPNQATFAGMIQRAGFQRVTYQNFSGGIAALHCGWKL